MLIYALNGMVLLLSMNTHRKIIMADHQAGAGSAHL